MNQKLLESVSLDLGLTEYDLLVFSDGSGTTVDAPCGWYSVLYCRDTSEIHQHTGGTNSGTNNYAELMPFVHALWAFESRRKNSKGGTVRVACVSDSEITVRCGNRQYDRKANLPLWSAMEWFEKNGYSLCWKHVPRNSNPISKLADRFAGYSRQQQMPERECKDGPRTTALLSR